MIARATTVATNALAGSRVCKLRELWSKTEGLRPSLCQNGNKVGAARTQLKQLEAELRRFKQDNIRKTEKGKAARLEAGRERINARHNQDF